LQEQQEYLSLYSDPDSLTTKKIKELRPDVKIVEIRTDEQMKLSQSAAKELIGVVAGASGR